LFSVVLVIIFSHSPECWRPVLHCICIQHQDICTQIFAVVEYYFLYKETTATVLRQTRISCLQETRAHIPTQPTCTANSVVGVYKSHDQANARLSVGQSLQLSYIVASWPHSP